MDTGALVVVSMNLKMTLDTLRQRAYNTHTLSKNYNALLDTTEDIPMEPMRWLLKYNITQDEIKKYGITWAPFKK